MNKMLLATIKRINLKVIITLSMIERTHKKLKGNKRKIEEMMKGRKRKIKAKIEADQIVDLAVKIIASLINK